MKTVIRKMGNSQGVIIPKPVLVESGLENEIEMTVERGAVVLRPARPKVRAGWAEASKAIADQGGDTLAWPEFSNDGDEKLKW